VPFPAAIMKNVRLRFFIVYNLNAHDRAQAISALAAMLAAGALQHNIALRLPLASIAEAHELVEAGKTMGNIVLSIE
jgi:NADPH:quinone reductase